MLSSFLKLLFHYAHHVFGILVLGLLDPSKRAGGDGSIRVILAYHVKRIFPITMDHGSNFFWVKTYLFFEIFGHRTFKTNALIFRR